MTRIKLPKRFNYAEAYLTLRCDLGCSYCINNKSGKATRKREELSVQQWANGLNRIDFGDLPLTLGGGEPTLYPGFFELLERLRPEIHIDLLTNLEFDIDEFARKTTPERFNSCDLPAYKSIRVSYHTEKMEASELMEKAVRLQDHGYNIGIFGLNHPGNLKKNMIMAEMACNNKMFFFVKDFLGVVDGRMIGHFNYPDALDQVPKNVRCRTHELLIGPEGGIYRCHRDLYIFDEPVGQITDPDLALDDTFRPCANYGNCNPCDVKIKTNRFLQMGNCSVDIIQDVN